MRIAVCEDDRVYLDRICRITKKCLNANGADFCMDMFKGGEELLKAIKDHNEFDLILMDIQMENSDGMEIVSGLREIGVEAAVVFVTGQEGRAKDGYRLEALDYVLKRELDERLPEALFRFLLKYRNRNLLLTTRDGDEVVLKTDKILWVESDRRGSRIVTVEKEYLTNIPIGRLSEMLPPKEYAEVYKSIYARVSEIKRIGKDMVTMSDGRELPMSRRKRDMVINTIMESVKDRI